MQIGLIGCGKVGTTLFYLLKRNNQIVGIYDIKKKHTEQALRLLHLQKNTSLKDICMKSSALFFATTDDQILRAYKKVKPFIQTKKYLYHFSGLLPAEIFPKSENIYRASLHPIATFPKIIIPPTRKQYILFIQGDREARRAAAMIFDKKYFNIKKITKNQKVVHHLLGVFSSNLMVGMTSAIYDLAKQIGWKERDLHEVVFPLIEETLNNIKKHKIKNALSGPLQRGDVEILKKHLKALKGNKSLLNTYKVLSLNILKNILKEKRQSEIVKLLKEL